MYGPVQGEVKISMTIQLKKGSNGNGATISLPRQPIKKDPTTPLPANAASYNQIAMRAYAIWQMNGCCHGRDQNDWLQAEYELSQLVNQK